MLQMNISLTAINDCDNKDIVYSENMDGKTSRIRKEERDFIKKFEKENRAVVYYVLASSDLHYLDRLEKTSKITFKGLVENYMADCELHLKPATLEHKRFLIDTKFLPYFETFAIENIDAYMIRQWQNTMITYPENYVPTYLKTLNNQLSAIFNFAVKFYGLPQNPVSVCGTMGKSKSGRLAYWTKEEFDSFIQEIEENSVYHVAFHVLFYSGMGEGEFLALMLDDFDFDQNTITINKSYACLKKEDVVQAPKTTRSVRKIVMPQEVMTLVKSYVDRLYGYERTDRVFQTSKMQLLRAMAKGCKKSGVPYIHIHDLRHSHASLLINLSLPPKVGAERLGHENIQTTLNTYSHLYPTKDREVAEKLSDLMND